MTLENYIADMDRRRRLAEAVGSSADYLWQIATKRRSASPKLVQKIETATGGVVTRYDLRSDVYGVGPSPSTEAANEPPSGKKVAGPAPGMREANVMDRAA